MEAKDLRLGMIIESNRGVSRRTVIHIYPNGDYEYDDDYNADRSVGMSRYLHEWSPVNEVSPVNNTLDIESLASPYNTQQEYYRGVLGDFSVAPNVLFVSSTVTPRIGASDLTMTKLQASVNERQNKALKNIFGDEQIPVNWDCDGVDKTPDPYKSEEEFNIIEFKSLKELVEEFPELNFGCRGDLYFYKYDLDTDIGETVYLDSCNLGYIGNTEKIELNRLNEFPDQIIKRNLGR